MLGVFSFFVELFHLLAHVFLLLRCQERLRSGVHRVHLGPELCAVALPELPHAPDVGLEGLPERFSLLGPCRLDRLHHLLGKPGWRPELPEVMDAVAHEHPREEGAQNHAENEGPNQNENGLGADVSSHGASYRLRE